jgi:hypothetical protein
MSQKRPKSNIVGHIYASGIKKSQKSPAVSKKRNNTLLDERA